jgi:hypothetical protein
MTNARNRPQRDSRNASLVGRTWPDVFMALLGRRMLLIGVMALAAVLLIWVHRQTAAGDRVEILGMPLWKKGAPAAPIASAAAPTRHVSKDHAPGAPRPNSASNRPEGVRTGPARMPSMESDEAADPGRRFVAVTLPNKREYDVGPKDLRGKYRILSASLSPQTSESDTLRIQVRVTSNAMEGFGTVLTDRSFLLRVSGSPDIEPARRFTENVSAGLSMDREVEFAIQRGIPNATLRIRNFTDSVDIPIELGAH